MELDDTLLGGLLIGLLPPILVVMFFWLQFPRGREPITTLPLRVMAGGMAVTLPVLIIQLTLDRILPGQGMLGTAAEAFVSAGVVEESLKLFAIHRLTVHRRKAFTTVQDGLFFGVLAGSGFGLVETAMAMLGLGTDVGVMRALTPQHAIWTGIMGYYVGLARFSTDRKRSAMWMVQGLLIAAALHGVWDFTIFASMKGHPLLALLMVPQWFLAIYLLFRRLVLARRVDAARRLRKARQGTGMLG